MTEVNLVDLQNNVKPIVNPFKFDFVWTWGKKPIVLRGDGKTRYLIAPLRDHLARHLFMKVKHQYHDEQARKLRNAGKTVESYSYRVPATVENKIWMMITGEPLPSLSKGKTPEIEAMELADISALKADLDQLDASAQVANYVADVSSLIDTAMNQSISENNGLSLGETGRSSGVAILGNATPEAVDPMVVTQPSEVPPPQPASTVREQTDKASSGGFDNLSELDNQ